VSRHRYRRGCPRWLAILLQVVTAVVVVAVLLALCWVGIAFALYLLLLP
jgi:hypothetical protein